MTIADQTSTPRAVPHAVQVPDRVPKQRYYDQEFFDLEAEMLWPRVWQMACRLEEIPDPFDFARISLSEVFSEPSFDDAIVERLHAFA